jgi:hypothetical protein
MGGIYNCSYFLKRVMKMTNSYRGISLLPTTYIILSYIISRLTPYIGEIIGDDYQCGF